MKDQLYIMIVMLLISSSIKCVSAQNKLVISAREILTKSIKKHDPNDHLHKLNVHLNMQIERANQPTRLFYIELNNKKGLFTYGVNSDSVSYSQSFSPPDLYSYQFNGAQNISSDSLKKYGITNDRTKYLKEVYEYLLGLPMRLASDIKYMSEVTGDTLYNGVSTHILYFNYIEQGSSESWKFFINKSTYILEGYQFYKNDINKDGEWIILKDYKVIKGVLMPKNKDWYWNKDNSHFRTDKIIDSY